MKKIKLPIISGLLSLGACSSLMKSNSSEKEMKRLEEVGRTSTNGILLPYLHEHFKKAGVPAPEFEVELVKLQLPEESVDPANQSTVDVTFKNLTVVQCQTLRTAYFKTDIPCGENGIFPWDNRRYVWTIKDFISPVMQATLKLTMIPETKTTGTETFTNEFGEQVREIVSAVEANCWSTAYEVSRQEKNQYSVHVIDSSDADKIFTNPTYTKFIFRGDRSGLETAIKSGSIGKFGDILIVRSRDSMLDEKTTHPVQKKITHAAIFVDGNLLFERIGNDGTLPMRLASLDDSLRMYPDNSFVYEVLEVSKPFPHVSQIPGVQLVREDSSEGFHARTTIVVKDFNLVKVGWEYQLPAEAFSPFLK